VGKADWRSCIESHDLAKRPLVFRPIVCRKELRLVAKIDDSPREALQITLGAAAGRIAAARKSNGEFFCHFEKSRDIFAIIISTSRRRSSVTLRLATGRVRPIGD